MIPNKQSVELMTSRFHFWHPLCFLEAFVTISLHGQCAELLSTWHLSFSIAKVMARPWIGNSANPMKKLFRMSCHSHVNVICLSEDCKSWSTVNSCQVFVRRFGLRNVDGLATILHSGHWVRGLVTSFFVLNVCIVCIKMYQTFKTIVYY